MFIEGNDARRRRMARCGDFWIVDGASSVRRIDEEASLMDSGVGFVGGTGGGGAVGGGRGDSDCAIARGVTGD